LTIFNILTKKASPTKTAAMAKRTPSLLWSTASLLERSVPQLLLNWRMMICMCCLYQLSSALFFLPLLPQYRNHSSPYTISCVSCQREEACSSRLWIWWRGCLCPKVRYYTISFILFDLMTSMH
jgi:hypothetical protein